MKCADWLLSNDAAVQPVPAQHSSQLLCVPFLLQGKSSHRRSNQSAQETAEAAAPPSNPHKRQYRQQRTPKRSTGSSGLRLHTPDVEDRRAHASTQPITADSPAPLYLDLTERSSSHTAAGFIIADHSTDEVAAAPVRGKSAVTSVALAAAPTTGSAEPFSIGVQWQIYYGQTIPHMPGYPAGYWSREASPFAALAADPFVS